MRALTEENRSMPAGEKLDAREAVRIRRAPWIALLGVDGSGKSSVLRRLSERSDELPFRGIQVFHRRPRLVYALPRTSGAPVDHYGKPNHGALKSMLKIAAMVLDWQLGYWRNIRVQTAQGFLVVADRHSLFDILADPRRYRYGGPSYFVHLALRCVPSPAAIVLLDAPEDVLHARKQELSLTQITELRSKYLQLVGSRPGSYRIDVSRPLDDVVSDILDLLTERFT